MAVRNLDAIQRYGNMIAEQKRNEYEMKKDNFWKRVGIIRGSQSDAIDAIDTINALNRNGLRDRFDAWDKQQNVHFRFCPNQFIISMGSCKIYYTPKTNHVEFYWQDHGMCEGFSTKDYMEYNGDIEKERYFFSRIYDSGWRSYDKLLTAMAERLQPYLNAFFDWVGTL